MLIRALIVTLYGIRNSHADQIELYFNNRPFFYTFFVIHKSLLIRIKFLFFLLEILATFFLIFNYINYFRSLTGRCWKFLSFLKKSFFVYLKRILENFLKKGKFLKVLEFSKFFDCLENTGNMFRLTTKCVGLPLHLKNVTNIWKQTVYLSNSIILIVSAVWLAGAKFFGNFKLYWN